MAVIFACVQRCMSSLTSRIVGSGCPKHQHLYMIVTTNFLSYDVTVIQWITLCHKNCMTRVKTLWCLHQMLLTMFVSTTCFLIELLFILNVTKSSFKGQYDKQNLRQEAISYEFMKLAKGLFHKFYMKLQLISDPL